MRTKKQIFLFQIVSWVVAYGFLGIIMFLIDESRAGIVERKVQMDLFFILRVTTAAGIFVGLALGGIDLLLKQVSNKKHSFRFYVIVRSLFYVITFTVILSIIITNASTVYVNRALGITLSKEGVRFVHSIIFTFIIYSIVTGILISFIAEVSKKFGPGILLRMFFGKYFNPIVEERIFMFIDLKSSTTYAEKLGHIKYSRLIQDCLSDLNISASKHKAEIYQYVGDEAVVTWTLEKGLKNSNYLKFYFDFQERITQRADYYKNEYDMVPEFKAGVNGGKITATEVGDIKREIAYHGDVINTAARIQGVCNSYDRKLLVSEFLAERINADNNYINEEIGSITLKGKEIPVSIYSVIQQV